MSANTYEQTTLINPEQPEDVVRRATEAYQPISTVALFSGGHDSTVLAHRCRHLYDSLAFIDTGTAVPGVREFVVEFADWLGKPLHILEAGDAYRILVRRLGFPGPAQHSRTYQRLKERQLDRLLRELKVGHPRSSRVLFLSGLRRSESRRRSGRQPITKVKAKVFACPLIDWSEAEMWRYRRDNGLPESDVAALLHRSGECNCGAFAAPGERRELEQLWPGWFERTIGSLEREVAELGHQSHRWGESRSLLSTGPAEPLCTDCQLRMALPAELSQGGE